MARVSAHVRATVVVEGVATTGASNATWYVRLDGVPAVLRHAPRTGAALATAHDVLREARVLRALEGTAVPVPRVLAACDDLSVLGVPFTVLTRVDGACLLGDTPEVRAVRDVLDPEAVAHDAIDVLAALHEVDASRLDDRRDGPGYLARQIDRWTTQLERTPTASRLGDLRPIAAWLHAGRPLDEERSIVHGDYGFHNLLVGPRHVHAVLDWELATVGDPLADLHSALKSWGAGAPAPNPANDRVSLLPGAPTRDDLLDRYAARRGRDVRAHGAFYEAFGLWRSVGIFEGIHARTGGARFAEETPALVDRLRAMMSAARDPR